MQRTITQLSSVWRQSRWICVAIVLATIMATLTGCGPSDPIQEAREQMAAGKLDEGLELLRKLIGSQPDNPELLFLYGRALVETGQLAPASWPLRKAMEDPNWFERSAMIVARIEIAGGNLENAAEIYAEILEENPDNISVRLQRANVCARAPLLTEEALAEVDRILEIAPDELGAYQPRILAYLSLNKPEEAGQAMEDLAARIDEPQNDGDPIRGWLCATRAIFAAESGDEPLARERWAVCEKEFPTHSNVVAMSVEFHRDRGDLQRALEVAEAAFDVDPSVDSGFRILVADLLRGVGRPDAAENLLLDAVASEESLSRAVSLLALTEHYKAVGDLVAAAESLERGLILTEKSTGPQPDLLFALADLLIQIGDGERAMELTRRMTVAAHRSLVRARVAHERKHYQKALMLYEETSRLWPENPYAPYHAGRAAMSVGQFDRAFKSFLLSIRVDESATDARCRAGQLLNAEGKPISAVEMLLGGRADTPPGCELLTVEILARTKGPVAASRRASKMSQDHPTYFGQAIAAGAKGAREHGNIRGAWGIVEPLLSRDFSPSNELPLLQAAVESAPGDEELALVKPLIARAVVSDGNSAFIRAIEGMFFERSGALDRAATSYRLALETEPNRVTTLLRLARITAASEPQAATKLIERALTQQESSSVHPFEPGLFLAAIAELPESARVEALIESALHLAPTSGLIALRLGTMLEASGGDAKRIDRLARRAIRFQQGKQAEALRDRVQARL
jgi:tetratricopeptide (TPR) repeat protein